jgi:hypothetical protein
MTTVELGMLTVGFAVLAQTAALFYWGGGVRQMLRDHERRLASLEGRE